MDCKEVKVLIVDNGYIVEWMDDDYNEHKAIAAEVSDVVEAIEGVLYGAGEDDD